MSGRSERPGGAGSAEDALDARKGWTALIVVGIASFQTAAGLSMVFVIYPDLARSFPGTSAAGLSWVLTGFTITGAATLVLGSAIGERYGRRRALMAGTILFAVASVGGALAPGVTVLVVARALQAVGASLILPNGATIVMAAFPPAQRGSAVAMWGAMGGAASAVGPSVGGLLVAVGTWRWAFWFNVPVAVVAVVTQFRLEDDRPVGRAPLPDLLGVPLLLGGVGLTVLGLVQSDDWGWGDAQTLGSFAGGALFLVLLGLRCRRHPRPVIAPSLAADRRYVLANLGIFLVSTSFFGFQFTAVQFLTGVWGQSISDAGLTVTPVLFLTGLAALVAGRYGERWGYVPMLVAGGAMLSSGMGALAFLDGERALGWWLATAPPIGLGAGLMWGSLFAVMVRDLRPEDLSVGASVNQTLQRLGNALGVALAVTVLGTVALGDAGSASETFGLLAALAVTGSVAGLAACRPGGRLPVLAVAAGAVGPQADAQWTSVR